MKKITLTACAFVVAAMMHIPSAKAQSIAVFTEDFDNFGTMLSSGWESNNLSNPVGTSQWQQGDLALGEIGYTGDSTSYLQDAYTATDPSGVGTISDWVLTPVMNLKNNDTVSLYTISYNSATYPDNLQVNLSKSGTSNNVGTTEFSVGDFSTVIFEINAGLNTTDYPSIQVAGQTWTKFSGVVTGVTGTMACRIGIRYFVTNGGGTGANSSTIGIDHFEVRRSSSAGIEENAFTANVNLLPNPASENLTLRFDANGNYQVNIYNSIGELVKATQITGTETFDLVDFAAGSYNVQVVDLDKSASKSLHFVKK